ncbi:MAG: MBL fold metallo-hydrolase [Candidatus Micrarchaeota archaeon]|nr:MBL fold metallo-hydrolase [Candidatus Micrarchaeota archaeon]
MEIGKMLFWVGHGSFYIKGQGKTIFIDPFRVAGSITEKADILLVTHGHFDHYSKKDMGKVLKPGTRIISAPGAVDQKEYKNVTIARPGFKETIEGIEIEAVPAYNTDPKKQQFHPRSNDWVGYIIKVEGVKIYHAGDTDLIPEMRELKGKGVDVALIPVGGTYTMDLEDGIKAAEAIGASHTVPMHFKNLAGKEGSERIIKEFKRRVKGALILEEVQEPTYGF